MYKIGLSSKSNIFSDELFCSYAKAGVATVEISNCTDGYDAIDLHDIKRLSDEYGVTLNSLHLPFKEHGGRSHDISNPSLYKEALESHKALISRAAEVGIKIFVLHPSSGKTLSGERAVCMEVCKKCISELADYADEHGAVIALENMAHECLGNTIAEFEQLVSSNPKIRVCFDTNHLLHENPGEFIRRLGKKIVTLHVSDCDLNDEQHNMPGEGNVDFPEILCALKEVGYSGPWLYEVSYKCPRTADDQYGLTPESFVENAAELFKGNKPVVKRDIRI